MGTENTFLLRIDEENLQATNEVILQSSPYIEQVAIGAVMNNYGSDSIVRIKDVQINELVGRTTTALTNLSLYRITGLTGGDTITPIKYDSAVSNLPSQVSIVKYPNTVTTTGSYLRKALSLTGLSPTTALRWHFGVRGSIQAGGMNLNHLYQSADSNVQAYVLREGEGFAIKTNLTSPQNYPVELIVHISDGTNTYCISEILNIQSLTELFAILNGSGSGVVLSIARVEMRSINTSDIYRIFHFETCTELYDGTSVSPLPMDSSVSSPDTLLEFRKNCVVRQGNIDSHQGRNARQGGDIIPFRRIAWPVFGTGVALGSGALTVSPSQEKQLCPLPDSLNFSQIVLREGEGFCILQKSNFAGWGRFEILILMTIEDNGGAVTGGEYSAVF